MSEVVCTNIDQFREVVPELVPALRVMPDAVRVELDKWQIFCNKSIQRALDRRIEDMCQTRPSMPIRVEASCKKVADHFLTEGMAKAIRKAQGTDTRTKCRIYENMDEKRALTQVAGEYLVAIAQPLLDQGYESSMHEAHRDNYVWEFTRGEQG